jgi:two-component system, cell cycle sensor histidine kinase and response regulator CckA
MGTFKMQPDHVKSAEPGRSDRADPADELERLRRSLAELSLQLAESERARRDAESRISTDPTRFTASFDGLMDGILINRSIRDETGRIVDFRIEYANEAASRISGLSHDELVGHRILELFPGRRSNGQFEAYVRVVETGEPLLRNSIRDHEVPGRSDPPGFGRDFEVGVTKLDDGYVATLHDIVARRRSQEDLFRAQQMLRLVLDTIPQRVFWKDTKAVFVGCNTAFARDGGLSDPAEIVGKTDYDLAWREFAAEYVADDAEVMRSGKAKLGYDEVQVRPDGSRSWAHVSKVPLLDADGQVVGLLGTYEDVTERRRAEEALRESEQLLASIVENVPDIVFVKDPTDLHFVRVNKAEERLLGYSRDELVGKDDRWLVPPEEAEFFRATDMKVLETGQVSEVPEEFLTTRDHGTRILHTTKVPILDDAGRPKYLLGISEDITDRRRAEEALRASERFLSDILENIPTMVFVKDARDFRFVRVNRAAERTMGYTRDELVGVDDQPLAPPEETAFFASVDRHVVETGETVEVPEEVLTVPGMGRRIMHTIKMPILDDEGRPRYVLGISDDITDLKAAEEARRDSEARYRHIIDTITDYVMSVKIEDGRAVSATHGPGCVAVTGYTADELSGDLDLWTSLVAMEDQDAAADQVRRLLAGENTEPLEHRIHRKDGAIRWVRHTPVLRFDSAGAPIAYDGLVQDITERRALQEQLVQSQKMESIGRLAGGVAHDFNNLLTAILGYVEMCKLDLPSNLPDDHAARLDLQEVATAGERAAMLTRQLLTFASRQIVAPVRIDLSVLVTDSLKMLQRLLGDDIEIQTAFDPDAGTVEADEGQIQQVVVNLTVNARDAMPKGGRLLIETSEEAISEQAARALPGEVPGRYVLLTVSDTGVGMTEEVQSHLFEPFFTTKGLGKGTGLGLATCHGIVKALGGHIRVYSEPGRGSSFRIYLPRKSGAVDPLPVSASSKPTPTGVETILVVEDESRVRQLAVLGLRAHGYVVLEAPDGAQAIEIVSRVGNTIDLIVSDVVMPGISGPELLTRLSAIAPRARSVLMSGYAESAVLSQQPDLHWAFLPKPFTPERLARKVREVLDAVAPGS